jgi:hypothetical protein
MRKGEGGGQHDEALARKSSVGGFECRRYVWSEGLGRVL